MTKILPTVSAAYGRVIVEICITAIIVLMVLVLVFILIVHFLDEKIGELNSRLRKLKATPEKSAPRPN